ncbi:uncharacterized protein [Montipora foliosa]|uniref:uncharacterized protein n=1 Tax=Montipora foliosa TaxID=591990 RepID=UPI0035F18001
MAPKGQIQVFVHGLQGGITTVNIDKDATVKEFFTLLSQKNGIPVVKMRAVYTTKQLEIGKRLSDYGMQNESNVFLVLRLMGGSSQDSSIPPEKVLDDGVELSDAPDMITWDDDPENKRAKMPCGHAITPESLTAYCRSILDAGRSRFLCPYISEDQPPVYCGVEWDYIDVRRLAVLTEEEIAEFEKKVSRNYLIKAMGIQECPKCNSLVERINKKDIRVVCPLCTKNEKAPYEFCWHCLHKWKNTSDTSKCGNSDCSAEDRRLKILRNCPRKTIVGVVGCPSLRACLNCGILIEHVRACKHMRCRCGKEFCFICLKPKEGSSWKCGSFNEACTIATVQTKIPGDN